MNKLIFISIMMFWAFGANATVAQVCSESELRSAIAAANAGDEIVMCSKEWPNLDLVFEVYGTAGASVTLRAERSGEAILTGRSRVRLGGSYAVVKGLRFQDGYPNGVAVQFSVNSATPCNNCRLTETAIIDYSPSEGSVEFDEYQTYVYLFGEHNRVDHNYFSGKHGKGQVVKVDVEENRIESHRIDHNYFGPRNKHPSGNNGEAIQIGGHDVEFAQAGVTVENNYFYRSNGEFEIISVKSSENIIRRNTFDRCEGSVVLRHGDKNWIDGNSFLGYRDGSKKVSGIRVTGDGHMITNNYLSGIKVGGSPGRGGINLASGRENYSIGGIRAATNILVAFNTIVDSDRSISADIEEAVPPSGIVIANNIVSSSYGPLISNEMPIENVLYSQNIVFGSSIGAASNGLIEVDPMLLVSDGIHRIAGNSPARDAANSEYTPLSRAGGAGQFIDSEGQSRSSSFYDVGADEYFNTGGPGLMSKCDTGPRVYNPGNLADCANVESGEVIPEAPTWASN